MKKKKPSTPVVRMTSHNAENIILLLEHLRQQFSEFISILMIEVVSQVCSICESSADVFETLMLLKFT